MKHSFSGFPPTPEYSSIENKTEGVITNFAILLIGIKDY